MKNWRKRLILFWLSFCSLFGAWKIVEVLVRSFIAKIEGMGAQRNISEQRAQWDLAFFAIFLLENIIFHPSYVDRDATQAHSSTCLRAITWHPCETTPRHLSRGLMWKSLAVTPYLTRRQLIRDVPSQLESVRGHAERGRYVAGSLEVDVSGWRQTCHLHL